MKVDYQEKPLRLLVEDKGRNKEIRFDDFSSLKPTQQFVKNVAESVGVHNSISSYSSMNGAATSLKVLSRWCRNNKNNKYLEEWTEQDFISLMSTLSSRNHEFGIKYLFIQYQDRYETLDKTMMQHVYVQGAWTERKKSIPIPPLKEEEAKKLVKACKETITQYRKEIENKPNGELFDQIMDIVRSGIITKYAVADEMEIPSSQLDRRLKKAGTSWEKYMRLAVPNATELIPYRILFNLSTGLSSECVLTIKEEDIQPMDKGKIRISWYKNRAAGKESDVFSNKSDWSPGKILTEVKELTKDTRVINKDSRIFCYKKPGYNENTTWVKRLKEFLKDNKLKDNTGNQLTFDWRSLRKTYYARLDKKYHGSVNLIAGINQSSQVAADHYLAADTENDLIRETLSNVQSSLVEFSRQSKATVIDEINISEATEQLNLASDEVKRILQTEEEDVFAAKCKSFYDSPHAPKGSPCSAAVWECLFCPLAIITPSKLPNILALSEHIDKMYEQMATIEWQKRYASARRAIHEHILPRFDDQVIKAAKAKMDKESIYLPPEEVIP